MVKKASAVDWGVAGRIATETPGRFALRVDSESITYGELIPALISRIEGLDADRIDGASSTFVPLVVDRSLESGLLILACLAAKIPCALMDSSLPIARREALTAMLPAESHGEISDGIVFFTSGTTGTPKAALVRWDTFDRWSSSLWEYSTVDLPSEPTSFSATPLSLLGVVLQLSRVLSGVDLVSLNPTAGTPSQFLDALITVNPTFVRFPAQLARILGHVQRFAGGVSTRTREVQMFGDGIRYESLHAISRFFPSTTVFSHLFSSTESGLTALGYRGTIVETPLHGPVALDFLTDTPHVRLVPADDELSGAFEIWVSGPISAGYLGDIARTESRFVIADGSRWWKSGDLVKQAEGGGYIHVGRRDDIVKVSGFTVSPSEVEKALYLDDNIRAATVLTSVRGERNLLSAFVVLKKHDTTIADITHKLTRLLPHYMMPSEIQLVDELPTTAGGKVNRDELTRLAVGESPRRKDQL